jgi:hypothetical protein
MRDRPVLALLPSPLLGPAVWTPVAERLRAHGREVVLPGQLPDEPLAPDVVVRWYLDVLPERRPVVVVPHSNAGLYVPELSVVRRVVAAVFVDAGIPPSGGAVPLAPLAFLRLLSDLVEDDGMLPPWTQWWPDDEVAALFPDSATRAAVEAEQRRIPFTYFRSELIAPERWDAGLSGGYLAFGETYADERLDAEERGWPTRSMAGQHLHMLVDPDAVTLEIERLMAAATGTSVARARPRR